MDPVVSAGPDLERLRALSDAALAEQTAEDKVRARKGRFLPSFFDTTARYAFQEAVESVRAALRAAPEPPREDQAWPKLRVVVEAMENRWPRSSEGWNGFEQARDWTLDAIDADALHRATPAEPGLLREALEEFLDLLNAEAEASADVFVLLRSDEAKRVRAALRAAPEPAVSHETATTRQANSGGGAAPEPPREDTTITVCGRADCRWQVIGPHYPHGADDFAEPIYAAGIGILGATPAEPGLREETFDELWDRTAALARANGLSLEEVTRGWRGTGYLAATLRRDNGGEDGCGVRDRDAEGDTPTAALRNLAAALSESGKGETE